MASLITRTLATLLAIATGAALAAPGNKALEVPPQAKGPLSRPAYVAARAAVERQFEANRKACARLRGDDREVCDAQAKGRRKAQLARLEARRQPSPDAVEAAKFATADANFAVARKKCERLDGKPRDRCMDEAKAAREAARRQARVEKVEAIAALRAAAASAKAAPRQPRS